MLKILHHYWKTLKYKLKLTLSAKMLLLLLFAFIPLLLSFVLFIFQVEGSLKKQVINERFALLESQSREITRFINDHLEHTELFSYMYQPQADFLSKEQKDQTLQNMQNNAHAFDNVCILDKNDVVQICTMYKFFGDWRGNKWYQEAKKTLKPTVSNVFLTSAYESSLAFIVPFSRPGEGYSGSVVAQIPMVQLTNLLDSSTMSNGEDIFVLNSANQIIAHNNPELLFNQFPYIDVARISESREGNFEYDDQSVGRSLGWYYVMEDFLGSESSRWKLVITQPESILFKDIYSYRLVMIVLPVLVFVLLFFIAFFWIKSVTNSLTQLTTSAQTIALGDLSIPITSQQDDEVGLLAKSFEQMRVKLKSSYIDLEKKVKEKTDQLSTQVHYVADQNMQLEDTKRAMLNLLEDVREQEEEAADEKHKLQTLLDSIGDAVFAINLDKEIILFNKACEILSGYTAKEALGQRYNKILTFVYEHDRTTNTVFIDDVLKRGIASTMTGSTLLLTKKGVQVPVADSAAPIHDSNGEVVGGVVVFRDVTHDREVERMKTEFVSVASHQLRTPLTSIKWYSEMLMNGDGGKLPEKAKIYLEKAIASTSNMVDLINSLLNVSRIETGKISIRPLPCNLPASIKKLVDEIRPLIKKRQQKLSLKLSNLLPSDYPMDIVIFREIFLNLLSNAIKYSPEIKGHIQIHVHIQKNNICFEIRDNGFGIPKSAVPKLFSRFYRAYNVLDKDPTGTGLGLYIVKELVSISGGTVSCSSKVNEGTVFIVKLPLSGMKEKSGELSPASTLSTQ
ncbi:MAG: ATP-binding protein [bacterium]